jgi:formiminoglutamase
MKIIKIPSSQGSLGKNLGCENAPDKILDELKRLSAFENELGRKIEFEIDEVSVDKDNIEETNKNIYEKSKEIEGVFIGGDHSITYSLFKGFAERYKNPGLLIFDAHADCVNDFKPASHEDFVKVLIKEGILKSENLIIIGLRNWHSKEREFLEKNKIKTYKMKDILDDNDVCDVIMEECNKFDGLYLSVDIDVLDPAFAPGTGYLEPGGMSVRQLFYYLHRLRKLKNLKAVDLVEVNPGKDRGNITVRTAARIVGELI